MFFYWKASRSQRGGAPQPEPSCAAMPHDQPSRRASSLSNAPPKAVFLNTEPTLKRRQWHFFQIIDFGIHCRVRQITSLNLRPDVPGRFFRAFQIPVSIFNLWMGERFSCVPRAPSAAGESPAASRSFPAKSSYAPGAAADRKKPACVTGGRLCAESYLIKKRKTIKTRIPSPMR